MSALAPIQDIIDDIRAGRMVILIDDEDRENEGDLVISAQHCTPEAINFMARHGRGLICLTLTEQRCQRLGLDLMVRNNGTRYGTAFTASIEAAEGVTTGISAQDRSRTVLAAVANDAQASDIVQPGHIFPLMAQNGGVLVRAGHTEAGCDLARLAGFEPAAVICEILKDDGSMARLPDLIEFAQTHSLKIGAIRDLINHRAASESLIERVAHKSVPTAHGDFQLSAYSDKVSGEIHLALSYGKITPEAEALVRVHEPVSVLDFIDPAGCRHSYSIDAALAHIAQHGNGALIMLHPVGSSEEMLAALGVEPNTPRPAATWDPRSFGIGAQILRDLGIGRMRVLAKARRMPSMAGFGLELTGYLEPQAN